MGQKISFYSDGFQIAGVLYEPDRAPDGSCPAIVLCQGMVGVKEYFWFPHIAQSLADMGYVALIWDYRGVGESEGEYGRLYPQEQSEDIRNGLTYLETNPKVDPDRLALLGFSFGAGMVPYVAGVDGRVRCAISVAGWGDGERWMRSLRRHFEWLDLLKRIERDRKSRVLTGKSELLTAGEILMADPATAAEREEVVSNIPRMEEYQSTAYSLATAEMLLKFKPADVVDRIAPRAILYVAAELDSVTPADDVLDMYERTKQPKKLKVIPGAAHYDVYRKSNLDYIMELATAWLGEHLARE
jgi:dipeptidyl aminopeptidase/acylaminoacyl peptidase